MTHKILIVDDSQLARIAVAKAVNALHPQWTRLEASSAEEALAQFNEHAPDIALLDFNMPGKDGLSLASDLRMLTPSTAVAVISADHPAQAIGRAQTAGAAFLEKPLTEKSLTECLNAAVAQRRPPMQ